MILVTGGAGFIGGAVVRRLVGLGHDVRVVDNLSKVPGTSEMAGAEYLYGNLLDPATCRRAFAGIDACFHLAARIGGIGYFHRFPADILDENGLMLSRVFRSALERGTKVVYVSSSMVFERTGEWPTPEDALDRWPPPFSAYGFSKLVGEWYCRAFHDQFGLPFAIARPFNAYGPGEHAEGEPGLAHVIPDLIRKILQGDGPVEIFGAGDQTRSFTFVDDVADAIVAIGTDPAGENQDFNIGTGVETSVRSLLDVLWGLCGREGEASVVHRPTLPVDVPRRVPEVMKIRERLGWTARVGLEEGLARTVAWFRSSAGAGTRPAPGAPPG